MALDDASDPFQQMVYLQEGEAPDYRLGFALRQSGNIKVKIISALDYSTLSEYYIQESELKNPSSSIKDRPVLISPNNQYLLVIVTSGYYPGGGETTAYNVVKIDMASGQKTISQGPDENGGFRYLPYYSATLSSGYLFITNGVTVAKFDPVNMVEVLRSSIPTISRIYNKNEIYAACISSDDTKCFLADGQVTYEGSGFDERYSSRSRIYDVNTSDLSLSVSYQWEKADNNTNNYLTLPVKDNGMFVKNGNYYCVFRRPDFKAQLVSSNGIDKKMGPNPINFRNYYTIIPYGTSNGMFLLMGDYRRRRAIVQIDESNGDIIDSELFEDYGIGSGVILNDKAYLLGDDYSIKSYTSTLNPISQIRTDYYSFDGQVNPYTVAAINKKRFV